MRVLLVLLALVVLSGCDLFQPREVVIDPTPEMKSLRAEVIAGRLSQTAFEKQVSDLLNATVSKIDAAKPEWTATAVSIVEDAARGAVAAADKGGTPLSAGGWLALLGSIVAGGFTAGAANARLQPKPKPGTVAVTRTPVPAPVGGAT